MHWTISNRIFIFYANHPILQPWKFCYIVFYDICSAWHIYHLLIKTIAYRFQYNIIGKQSLSVSNTSIFTFQGTIFLLVFGIFTLTFSIRNDKMESINVGNYFVDKAGWNFSRCTTCLFCCRPLNCIYITISGCICQLFYWIFFNRFCWHVRSHYTLWHSGFY